MKPSLYAITDSQLMPGQALFDSVAAALMGGCRRVQYRDKSADPERRLAEASRLLKICRDYNAELIINDDIQLARMIKADGVHLGQEDASPLLARELLGKNAIIGVTCHASLSLAKKAQKDGATYVAFGRFFLSLTKPEAPPAPLSLLSDARKSLGDIPIVAIGGITLENAASVIAAGADMLAVSYSLFSAKNIELQANHFIELQNYRKK